MSTGKDERKETPQESRYSGVDLATTCLAPHGKSWNATNIHVDKTVSFQSNVGQSPKKEKNKKKQKGKKKSNKEYLERH